MLKPLTSKLLIISTLPAIIITLLIAAYSNYSRLQDSEHYLLQRGENSSMQLAILAKVLIQQNQSLQLQRLASNALEENGVRSVNFYNEHAQVIAHAGPKTHGQQQLRQSLTLKLIEPRINDEHSVHFISPIQPAIYTSDQSQSSAKPSPLGWVSIEYSKDRFTLNRYNSLLEQNAFFLLCLFLAIISGLAVNIRLNADIQRLRNAIKKRLSERTENSSQHYNSQEFLQLEDSILNLNTQHQLEINELRYSMELTTSDLQETIETIEIQNVELGLAQKQALQSSKIKSEFLANTSHEIRTPLNGIIGFSKILKRTPLNALQQEYLETIMQSSDGLLNIINDILDFSKIEADKLELEPGPCHLRQIFEEVLHLFAPLAIEKKLDINLLFYQDVPCHLYIDAARLKQVLSNIVNNAIKFTHHGEIVIRVMLENEDAHTVKIKTQVEDTGIGMTAEQQKNLFQAFNQSNPSISRQYGGTGLGLAISKKLIEKFGGDISVSSQTDKGSIFNFDFQAERQKQHHSEDKPAFSGKSIAILSINKNTEKAIKNLLAQWQVHSFFIQEHESPDASIQHILENYHLDALIYAPSNSSEITDDYDLEALCDKYQLKSLTLDAKLHSSSNIPVTETSLYRSLASLFLSPTKTQKPVLPQYRFPHLKVLAVDDNQANLKLLSILLTDLGIDVHTANNGQEAIAISNQFVFDVIFMDLQMPIMDGYEASKNIRQSSQTPIIALTAHALADEKKRLLEIGVNAYLSKPINESILIDTLSTLCPAEKKPNNESDKTSAVNVHDCLKLANFKTELAATMFTMLVDRLENDVKKIQLSIDGNIETFLDAVHTLNGACSYTGVPQLKSACMNLETALKEQHDDAQYSVLLDDLLKQSNAVIFWHKNNDIHQQLSDIIS